MAPASGGFAPFAAFAAFAARFQRAAELQMPWFAFKIHVFHGFWYVDGRRGHQFLLHVPCETLDANLAPVFPPWGHDFASAILDMNFSNLHRVLGAMIPMVRRTSGFGAAKPTFKTN